MVVTTAFSSEQNLIHPLLDFFSVTSHGLCFKSAMVI